MSGEIIRVGIVAKSGLLAAADHLDQLASWLRARNIEPIFDTDTGKLTKAAGETRSRNELPSNVDLVVVMGGDGTLLGMATRTALAGRDTPILGVNFGSLGFLTEITLAELYPTLEGVLADTYQYEERRMLHAVVRRHGRPDKAGDVLNDVVVTKAALSRIIELDVTIDGIFVSAFRADGLIISSPTGSTAYNLAAGGPILHPSLPAVVVTPICPHMLTNRPLAVSDEATIEVCLRPARDVEAHVTFDGQRGFPLSGTDTVTVTRSPLSLRLVKAPARDFFAVLRTKLKWGESTAQRR